MAKRTGVLEVAVLGLLHESPMHGYELRKRLNTLLGTFRAISYGSLYPCLKGMLRAGWIAEEEPAETEGARPGKRAKIVYKLTADGKEHFAELMAASGPEEWDDDNFGVRFAFFSRTDAAVRLRILEGRRGRLEERMDGFRNAAARTAERVDSYTLELQRHGLESVAREVRWLTELIDTERANPRPAVPPTPSTTTENPK
ncbi:PadR family transcriptional regulator [Sporichthya polymorpha]|uniref:PadR family transcriptional regulator n=1 Tax=Sporichthya polymorpha TaxID=35751 RepID=UPI0003650E37|nr:PadR family transcriptional regulator [Sporichthya polymorpha]